MASAEAMEIDEAPATEDEAEEAGAEAVEAMMEEEDLPDVTLDIFDVSKTAQAQHGLRHGDYGRYRQYCSRRLHRLRKATRMTHGKGRYLKRPLEPHMVREGRHLMIVLFCSERAWAHAMEIKRDNTNHEPRPRFHLLNRLAKAAKWAAALSAICAARADKRTALEAEAYAAFMGANVHLEREEWAPAREGFARCRTICVELCRVSMAEQVHLYRTMVDGVEPSIRFCAYHLSRMDGADDSALGDEVEGARSSLS